MAKAGVLGCRLSLDGYHDPISEEVVVAFRDNLYDSKLTDHRDVTQGDYNPVNSGRCDFGTEGCVCPVIVVKPNGDIYACGCSDAPLIGNVACPEAYEDVYSQIVDGDMLNECWKSYDQQLLEKISNNTHLTMVQKGGKL